MASTGKTVLVTDHEGGEVAKYLNAKIVIESGMLMVKSVDDDDILFVGTVGRNFAHIVEADVQ